MNYLIEQLKLQLKILFLQLRVLLLKQKLTIPNLPEPKKMVLHHGGGVWNFEQVNHHHTEKWGFISSLGHGIGYHYWISFLGKVTQGRADNEEGAHCVETGRLGYWNKNSIGICLQGNFDEQEPTIKQLCALESLLERLKVKHNIGWESIYLHKDIKATSCPGKKLIVQLEQRSIINQ